MRTILAVSFAALGLLLSGSTVHALPTTSFSSWQAGALGPISTVTFEDRVTGAILTGNEYAALGLTITQRDGDPIRVGSPGDTSFLSAGNLQSQTHTISSTAVPVLSYDDSLSENYDFAFAGGVPSAGLWVGNLNPGNDTVTVQFLDGTATVLDSILLSTTTAGLVSGGATQVDNRIFVGLHSATPIATIRILAGDRDADGNNFDDVSWVNALPVPEPTSLTLLGLGSLGLLAYGRRRRPARAAGVTP